MSITSCTLSTGYCRKTISRRLLHNPFQQRHELKNKNVNFTKIQRTGSPTCSSIWAKKKHFQVTRFPNFDVAACMKKAEEYKLRTAQIWFLWLITRPWKTRDLEFANKISWLLRNGDHKRSSIEKQEAFLTTKSYPADSTTNILSHSCGQKVTVPPWRSLVFTLLHWSTDVRKLNIRLLFLTWI